MTYKYMPQIIVAIAIALFIVFGLFHLGKFETTDEHFWKYDRIEKYYHGIRDGITNGVWKKTRVNDKPGVSVALVSGIGLPFAPDPDTHRDVAREKQLRVAHGGTATSVFHTEQTERLNFALRLPILLFSAAMLGVLFWLFTALVRNALMAAVMTFGIATLPAMIGMSQVINPDAILWSTMVGAIIAFMAAVRHGARRYTITAGILCGVALLSKYTASLLFLLFPLILFLFALYEKHRCTRAVLQQWMRRSLGRLFGSAALGCALFALAMPAVFQKPEHFLYGTFFSPALAMIALPFFVVMILWSIDAFLLHSRLLHALISTRYGGLLRSMLRIVSAALLLLLSIVTLLNAWRTTPWLPLSHLKEIGRDGGELVFPQIIFADDFLHAVFVLVAQVQNFFFALPLSTLIGFILALTLLLYRTPRKFAPEQVFVPILALLFFVGGTMANIFVNVRYAIILYPMAIALAVLALWDPVRAYYRRIPRIIIGACVVIALLQIAAPFGARPFYLTYENALLPRNAFVADAWGYGLYEAAQWLNAQDDAKNLVVWSSAGGDSLCQFFKGSCLRPQKIDLEKVVPDYIILTRRRSIIRPLQLKNTTDALSVEQIYRHAPVWELFMNGRPDNFVKIYRVR